MKGSGNLASLRAGQQAVYAALCGWALARAHARSGGHGRLSGYIRQSSKLDKTIARFAERYAHQTAREHAMFRAALDAGHLG